MELSPLKIPKQCILRFSKKGDTNFDPFCDSGTTLIASAKLHRNSVGVEINPKIAEIARLNLKPIMKFLKTATRLNGFPDRK